MIRYEKGSVVTATEKVVVHYSLVGELLSYTIGSYQVVKSYLSSHKERALASYRDDFVNVLLAKTLKRFWQKGLPIW